MGTLLTRLQLSQQGKNPNLLNHIESCLEKGMLPKDIFSKEKWDKPVKTIEDFCIEMVELLTAKTSLEIETLPSLITFIQQCFPSQEVYKDVLSNIINLCRKDFTDALSREFIDNALENLNESDFESAIHNCLIAIGQHYIADHPDIPSQTLFATIVETVENGSPISDGEKQVFDDVIDTMIFLISQELHPFLYTPETTTLWEYVTTEIGEIHNINLGDSLSPFCLPEYPAHLLTEEQIHDFVKCIMSFHTVDGTSNPDTSDSYLVCLYDFLDKRGFNNTAYMITQALLADTVYRGKIQASELYADYSGAMRSNNFVTALTKMEELFKNAYFEHHSKPANLQTYQHTLTKKISYHIYTTIDQIYEHYNYQYNATLH